MSPVLRFAYELIPVSFWFATVYMAFFALHRPPTRVRRWALLILMGAWAAGNEFVFLPLVQRSVLTYVSFFAIHAASFGIFALVCGDLRRSLITAIYAITSTVLLDYIGMFARFVSGVVKQFISTDGLHMTLDRILADCVVWLLWTVFYCRISKKYPVKLPLRSWLVTALPPVISCCALLYLWNAAGALLEVGINIHGIALVAGIFVFLLNGFLFYWHTSLLATHQAEETLKKLRNEVPAEQKSPNTGTPVRVWIPQAGFTDAFAVKYKLSRREKQALELVLAGKSDKEIAAEMGITSPTASVYLHRVYKKTGVSGRFDLLTFVHSGVAQNTGLQRKNLLTRLKTECIL